MKKFRTVLLWLAQVAERLLPLCVAGPCGAIKHRVSRQAPCAVFQITCKRDCQNRIPVDALAVSLPGGVCKIMPSPLVASSSSKVDGKLSKESNLHMEVDASMCVLSSILGQDFGHSTVECNLDHEIQEVVAPQGGCPFHRCFLGANVRSSQLLVAQGPACTPSIATYSNLGC